MTEDIDDHQLARRVAVEAGVLLVELRDAIGADTAADVLRSRGDQESHRFIVDMLARLRPDDAVLSEEGVDDRRRLDSSRVWIVDPLDGTREFGELGRSDWAVHVALWSDGELEAGAVAMPAHDAVYSTAQPPPQQPFDDGVLRIAVSRTRAPRIARELAAALGAELVPMGSAGAKAMAVVTGDVDMYVHSGGQYEWDSAAPVVVARSAGLHASRIDGAPLQYNRSDAWLPDLLLCRPELSDRVLALVAQLS
ncbi:MAG TPA: 3'(2'),5'-bisphosphate nucleotidase CysQ [Candidatus Angelobacter sp.]|jgi:3'(2'), 5'-bisphosphate nucleotidase|nr:3'(2'),5'-bisphosphate nucleotidase CysQ [Candidatus Angelobacter sp.]